jgi:hypothetical protein
MRTHNPNGGVSLVSEVDKNYEFYICKECRHDPDLKFEEIFEMDKSNGIYVCKHDDHFRSWKIRISPTEVSVYTEPRYTTGISGVVPTDLWYDSMLPGFQESGL